MKKLPISAMVMNCGNDSELILTRALASIWFCDQIVFLAHNSTSTSLAIAERFGCDIYKWDKEPHMANQRMYMLEKCKYNDLLQCDSDEVFAWDAYPYIKELISHDYKDVYLFSIRLVNMTEDNRPMSITPLQRIFKKGIWWESSIQNQLNAPNHNCVIEPNVTVFHYGYGSVSYHTKKQWKRISYNEDMVRENPSEPHRRMYLANALSVVGAGQPNSIDRLLMEVLINIQEYKLSAKESQDKLTLQKMMRFLFIGCESVGQFGTFLLYFKELFDDISYHPDCHYWMFVSYYNLGDAQNAIKYGASFVKKLKTAGDIMVTHSIEVTTLDNKRDVIERIIDIYKHMQPKSDKEKKYIGKQIKRWTKYAKQ